MVNNIVDEVLRNLCKENFTSEQLKRVEGTLFLVLNKYEISEKTTDVQVINSDWQPYLNYFLERKRIAGKSEGSIELYRYHLSRALASINKGLDDISEIDIVIYLEQYRRFRKVSNSYLDSIRLCLTNFFSFTFKKGITHSNPADGLEKISSPKEIKKAFSDEELERIRRACTTARDKAMIEFMYSTGVRVSELCSLNRDDISIHSDEVKVMGKGSKERIVYLSRVCKMYLFEYLNSRDDDNPSLFVSNRNPHQRMSAAGIQRVLRRLGKAAKVDDCHPHRFRRTMATNLLRKGMPIEEVQVVLGHEKIETTLVYTDICKESVKSHHMKYMAG